MKNRSCPPCSDFLLCQHFLVLPVRPGIPVATTRSHAFAARLILNTNRSRREANLAVPCRAQLLTGLPSKSSPERRRMSGDAMRQQTVFQPAPGDQSTCQGYLERSPRLDILAGVDAEFLHA